MSYDLCKGVRDKVLTCLKQWLIIVGSAAHSSSRIFLSLVPRPRFPQLRMDYISGDVIHPQLWESGSGYETKENSATTVCCATHYNEPLLKAGKYLVANALPRSGDVIHPQLWESGSGYETKFSLARAYKQAFRSDRELLFSMNSLQSTQLVLLKCIAQRWKETNSLPKSRVTPNLPVHK